MYKRNIFSKLIFIFCFSSIINFLFAENIIEKIGWKFINWGIAYEGSYPENLKGFTWDIYRQSYIGIPSSRAADINGADSVFYDTIYSQLTGAHCFGMSLLSQLIVKNGGYMGICGPLSNYSGNSGTNKGPQSPTVAEIIKIMHSHQLNIEATKYYAELALTNDNGKWKSRNGLVAFNSINDAINANEGILLSITKTYNPSDGAHTVVPYKVENGNPKKIYVYDSNYPYLEDTSFYDNQNNYIQVNNDGSWSYAPLVYSGNPSDIASAHILAIPISMVTNTSRSAVSLLNELADNIFVFTTDNQSEIVQIKDDKGGQLYKTGTNLLNTDDTTRIKNIVPLMFLSTGVNGIKGTSIFYLYGNHGNNISFDIKSNGKNYKLVNINKKGYIIVNGSAKNKGLTTIQLKNLSSIKPALALTSNIEGMKYNVEMRRMDIDNKTSHSLNLNNLELNKDNKVLIEAIDNMNALKLETTGNSTLKYNLALKKITKGKVETIEKNGLYLPTGSVKLIRPENWEDFSKKELQITVEKNNKQ